MPAFPRLVRGAAAVALATAPAGLLGGCVAAIVPLAAGGLIARQASGPRTAEPSALPRATTVTATTAPPTAQSSASPVAPAVAPPQTSPELLAQFERRPPATAAGSASGDPFAPFVEQALAHSRAASGERFSALLAEPSTLAPDKRVCTDAPGAVLIDLDPAGGLAPLDAPASPAPSSSSAPAPGLASQLAQLRAHGITVAWITDRSASDAGALRRVLRDSRLDPTGADPLLVMRYPGEAKQARRRSLGAAFCILAIAGDERADFEDLYLYLREPALALRLETLIGDAWFLVPPPLERAIPSPSPTPSN